MAKRGSVSVKVSGTKEISLKLDKISRSFSGKQLDEAALAGATPVRQRASELAPRSRTKGHHKQGHAADHIVIEVVRKVQESVARVGPDEHGYYLRFIELGTSKIRANPFLRTALDSMRNEVKKIMLDKLMDTLRGLVK